MNKMRCLLINIFFFNDTATTEIYTLSLHDALPICTVQTEPLALGPRSASEGLTVGGRPQPILSPSALAFLLSSPTGPLRSEEHTSELQSPCNLVCRLLLEKKKRIS